MRKSAHRAKILLTYLIAGFAYTNAGAAEVSSGVWAVYSGTGCTPLAYFSNPIPSVVADDVCANVFYSERVCAMWPDSEVAESPPSIFASVSDRAYGFNCTNGPQLPSGMYSIEYDETTRLKDRGPPKCNGIGNPINSSIGNKYEEVQVVKASGERSIDVRLRYNSRVDGERKAFGHVWRHSYESRVYPSTLTLTSVTSVWRSDGKVYGFKKSGSAWIGSADSTDKLEELTNSTGVTSGWRYTTQSNDVELYSAEGILLSVIRPNGVKVTLTYSDGTAGVNGGYVLSATGAQTSSILPSGLLIHLTNSLDGSTVNFGYDSISRVVNLIDGAGNSYVFGYAESSAIAVSAKAVPDGGALTSIKFPDGAVRTFWYNEQDKTDATDLPDALTGVSDENGIRFATWYYNSVGQAISSEHAGGVEKYSVSYLSFNNTRTYANPY